MNQFTKPVPHPRIRAYISVLREIMAASRGLRFGVILILMAVTLSGCTGLLECPSEFGTPSARARWCGPGGAGQ